MSRMPVALAATLAIVVAVVAHVAAAPAHAADAVVRHKATKFSITAPRGATLSFSKGVYRVRSGTLTVSFSRSITTMTPSQFGAALLGQLRGKVVSRQATRTRFTAEVSVGARREAVIATRKGATIVVVTGTSPARRPARLATIMRIGATAAGGVSLRPPAATTAVRPIALTSYRAPDGGATAQVPAGAEWQIASSQGAIAGFSNRGSFLLGYSINIGNQGWVPTGYSRLVFPFMSAADALRVVFPQLDVAQGIGNIQVKQVVAQDVLAGFTSSAMYLFDYTLDGKAWTGAAMVGTDSPLKYSNLVWNLYYSGIAVPVGTGPEVGLALLKTWQSWDASGAIAQRAAQAKQLIDETNEVWQQTSEFRSKTADRQARDVGCLLAGYYHIEDNSRRYDLPPLPCGQTYVR